MTTTTKRVLYPLMAIAIAVLAALAIAAPAHAAAIDSTTIVIDAPQAGTHSTQAQAVVTSEGAELQYAWWQDHTGYSSLEPDTLDFVEGQTYFAVLTLNPKDGYEFKKGSSHSLDTHACIYTYDGSCVAIDGQTEQPWEVYYVGIGSIENKEFMRVWLKVTATAPSASAAHTVTFDTGDHWMPAPAAQTVEHGGHATAPDHPKVDKSTDGNNLWFWKWFTEPPSPSSTYQDFFDTVANGGKIFDFSTQQITEDTTLYAGWNGTLTLESHDVSNNETHAGGMVRVDSPFVGEVGWSYGYPQSVMAGTNATIYAKPDSSYRFVGWSTSTSVDDVVSTDAEYTFLFERRITLYALYEALPTTTVPQVTWKRFAGATAPDTMKMIAGECGKTKFAIVTTDSSYKDALAASALAGKCNGLVLMTKKGSLTKQTKETLRAAGVKTVYIVGSTGNVSAAVEKQLKSGTGVTKVVRIGGATPSQRAVAAAKYGGKKSDTVIIATQNGFQDALSIAPYSYVTKSPILYAETNKKLSTATVNYIKSAKFKKAIIVGGPIALPASIETQLKKAGVTSVTRLAGSNLYATSQQIADWTTGGLKNGNYGTYKGKTLAYIKFQPATTNKLQANNLAVTTGQNWLDALAGAALCGKKKSVLLLADAKTTKSNYTLAPAWCKKAVAKSTAFTRGYIFGGDKAVQPKVETALRSSTMVTKVLTTSG